MVILPKKNYIFTGIIRVKTKTYSERERTSGWEDAYYHKINILCIELLKEISIGGNLINRKLIQTERIMYYMATNSVSHNYL